ncbi:MAG: 3-deoxy-manno-octulosonate cytidylyltransferase [Gammaproteobacteria bacterium]|nr:3-deoxy-manno-octulosonate cytidylyltransferase [Gammaproteobacteria bacterium]
MSYPFRVVIPARYQSTRLPGKPLIELAGKPMVQRVVEQALQSSAMQTIVATDDVRIEQCLKALNYDCILTSTDHRSGSDRIEEVTQVLSLKPEDVVVNVQGDEPLIPPRVIDQVASLLFENEARAVATLYESITDGGDFSNPNVVKVVVSEEGTALYFSRAPIPWDRDGFAETIPNHLASSGKRHIGIYAYRVSALREFVRLAPSVLEKTESLEQLRFLSNGYSIAIAEAEEKVPGGVDTPADATYVEELLISKGKSK